MIVWIASYPRSGNTYFRILLHRLLGLPTYDSRLLLSGDDLLLDTGKRLTGVEELPARFGEALRSGDEGRAWAVLEGMDAEPALYCIVAHTQEAPAFGRAVLIVRDGRDVAVSLAWYVLDVIRTFRRAALALRAKRPLPRRMARLAAALGQAFLARASRFLGFRRLLWRRVLREQVIDGSWSRFHDNWLARRGPTVMVRYEDLVADPIASVENAMHSLGVEVKAGRIPVPTFEELKAIHPSFFRSGRSTWREEMPPEEVRLFHANHGACLARLGYGDLPR